MVIVRTMSGSDDEPDHYMNPVRAEAQERDDDDEDDDMSSDDEEFNPDAAGGSDGKVAEEFDSSASDSSDESGSDESGSEKKKKKEKKEKKPPKPRKAKTVSEKPRKPRKPKKVKDETKPKFPMSGYFLFFNENRESIKKDNPGISPTEVSKKAGELWRGMEDKTKWEKLAVKSKEEYKVAMEEWKAAGGGQKKKVKTGAWCQVCKLSGTHTAITVAEHMQGAKHLRRVACNELLQKLKESTDCFDHDEATGMLKCKVCNIELNTPQLLEVHLSGAKHKMRVEGRPVKRKHDGDPNHTPAKLVAPNPEDAERTVFLKNMSFKSTEEDIRAVFEDCGEIESLYCIKAFGRRKKGYLMFKDKEAAVKALEKDKTVLEEHPMYVSAYNPEERKDHTRSGEPEKDKLFVSGLPATMTEKEIRTLFEPHGEIKDLRMLRKKKVFNGMCYLNYGDEDTAAAVKEATHQFELGPEQKITVQFSYPPWQRKGFKKKRH